MERSGTLEALESRPDATARTLGHSDVDGRDDGASVSLARRVVDEVFGPPSVRPFAIRHWTGELESGMPGVPAPFTLHLRVPGALRDIFLPPSELALGEAFVRGDIDIDGDLEAAAATGRILEERLRSPARLARLLPLLLRLPRTTAEEETRSARFTPRAALLGRRHARRRDAAAIRHHYDVGNEFYALWLDPEMVYSCAYFPDGVTDLDVAQRAKLDLICRKLRLQPGQTLLDVGCGWGGLIRHAARHYGVSALGITLSPSQAELARARIAEEGLADRCRVEVRDYRDLPPDVAYDRVVSVGMFEHVGRSQLSRYFAAAHRLTKPGGAFLNHGIISLHDAARRTPAQALVERAWRGGAFLRRYVFPDSALVTLTDAIAPAEAAGFETRDVESLREHYARTLRHWVARLERHAPEAIALAGAERYRVWRLYMAASAHAFASARVGIVQVLFARPTSDGRSTIPATRADLYRAAAGGGRAEAAARSETR
jgi:cyclopropane-fatty-acyl-phospholipid synthase